MNKICPYCKKEMFSARMKKDNESGLVCSSCAIYFNNGRIEYFRYGEWRKVLEGILMVK